MITTFPASSQRLAYIDWMRGLACVLMIQAHCYDSWLSPDARTGAFYRWSQEISTLAAPLFLFLCGVSFVLVTERLVRKGTPRNEIFKTAVLRGAEILGFGFLLRLQEFVLGYPKSPWTDLLKVDVLNILGISVLLMALFWRVIAWQTPGTGKSEPGAAPVFSDSDAVGKWRGGAIVWSLLIAALIALATPPLYTTHRPRFLPWMLESYVNGVHNYNTPESWIFSIFPWCGFAFVGLAFALFLFTDFAKRHETRPLLVAGAVGALGCALSLWWDASSVKVDAVYDYWRSSPNFFLMRCGILLLLAFASYAWCRWGFATKGFSPVIQMGRTSLLVYWAHIEFVYGRLSILPKERSGSPLATMGMAIIFAAMLGLSIWRTSAKKREPMKLGAVTTPSAGQSAVTAPSAGQTA